MSPLKWIYIVLFAATILDGIAAKSVEETKSSSAKECRQHIDKALEQYWDEKGPRDDRGSAIATDQQSSKDYDEEDDGISINRQTRSSDERQQELADQDDDDDDDDDDEDTEDEKKDLTDEEEDYDDDDENTGVDDEDDGDSENGNDENDNGDDEDDDENDGEEDDDDDDDTTEEESKTKQEIELDDEDDDDDDDVKIDAKNDSDDDDDDDDDDDENNSDKNEDGTTDVKDDDDGDEDDEDDEDEIDDEDDNEDDDEEEEDTDEDKPNDASKNITLETNIPSKATENKSSEVTGEIKPTSSAKDTPVPDASAQPAAQVEKSVPNITASETRNQKDSDDDDDDDGDEDDDDDEPESDDENDDTIENIYEEDDAEPSPALTFRSRDHIDVILGLNDLDPEYEKEAEKLAQTIFKDIKKIETISIRPIEMLYKFSESTTQVLTDAEIFNKPMILFLGPWNAGKTTIINYILGLENTPTALKTGTGITDVDFTVLTHGDRPRVVSGMELATDWRYAGLQKFGQGFLDHFRSIHVQNALLKKVTIVDTPGILENRKTTEREYHFNDVFQWFIDRADIIYVVLDPTKVDIGAELGSVIEELKGHEVRFILNKADTIRRSDLMRVVGQLFWNLSPLLSSAEAPVIYAASLSARPYHPSAPAKFLADQEKNFLYDMKDILDLRVENRILYARKHGVRVRNHAQMVDCYLASYYRHKSIFSNKRNTAKLITENPSEYNIYDGMGGMTNVSRHDIPNPHRYKEFFKVHPLYDFKPLASTCSYFRGCPMEKLDLAVAKEIPELLAKYKKSKHELTGMLQQDR